MFRDLLDYYSAGRVLPFDDSPATTAMGLKRQHKVRLKPMDLRIAATALTHDLTVLSRNSVDFEHVPGLSIEDWTQ
jgi:tRNA(fMet)-specific endonuclease VapC